MKERHSILRPLTIKEQELFAQEMIHFFSPFSYEFFCEIVGVPASKKETLPFSYGQYLRYLRDHKGIMAFRYDRNIRSILMKFLQKGLLYEAGTSSTGSPPFNSCYYSMVELTNLQKGTKFWLGNILGEEFLKEKYRPYIIRIEGYYENGESGTGSGILINKNTILTCRHNIMDLKEYSCYIGDEAIELLEHKVHEVHDIGIIKLKIPKSFTSYPYFGNAYELDNTLTLGYPPLRGMREAALITQKGEINAISKDWQNCSCITISSTVRPGNSGGPVISLNGYIVGIVTQYANSASSVSVDKDDFKDNHSIPFYNAIASTSLMSILLELDKTCKYNFEDYQ